MDRRPQPLKSGAFCPSFDGHFRLRALVVFLSSLVMLFAFHSAFVSEGLCFADLLASSIFAWGHCIRRYFQPETRRQE